MLTLDYLPRTFAMHIQYLWYCFQITVYVCQQNILNEDENFLTVFNVFLISQYNLIRGQTDFFAEKGQKSIR